ncbi:MAG: hypothetical protein JW841_03345 [Deltaproteobacteria bacterium]|nr:hypothetical protein [Deltaproteobacteria bacterium]
MTEVFIDLNALTANILQAYLSMLKTADYFSKCFVLAEDLRVMFEAWQKIKSWSAKHENKCK